MLATVTIADFVMPLASEWFCDGSFLEMNLRVPGLLRDFGGILLPPIRPLFCRAIEQLTFHPLLRIGSFEDDIVQFALTKLLAG